MTLYHEQSLYVWEIVRSLKKISNRHTAAVLHALQRHNYPRIHWRGELAVLIRLDQCNLG
jgi:hypothetical protein